MNKFLEKKIARYTYDWTAMPTSASFAAADISEANETITINNHPFQNGDMVAVSSGTAATVPAANTNYYVIYVDQNTIQLATSAANAYAGTHTDLTAGSASGAYLTKNCFGTVKTGIVIPKGAIITGGYIDVKTSVTSDGSATIAFGTGLSTTDLLAATAKATLAADYTTAVLPGSPALGSSASLGSTAALFQALLGTSYIEATSDTEVVLTIATASLSAGKFDVVVEYVV